MPAVSAGLLRFFEEESTGVKIRPEVIVLTAVSLIIMCILAQLYSMGSFPIP
jgi:preprotein translocase subunit Sec61beta